MKDGFIYVVFDNVMNSLRYLNLVELFKTIGVFLASKTSNDELEVKYSRISVDIFIILKWVFVLVLWFYNVSNYWLILFVWYLLISNLYTYFYYHVWSSKILEDVKLNTARKKRRFLNLILAVNYSIYTFAYLYSVPYATEFKCLLQNPKYYNYILFSISNSLTSNYDIISPVTEFANIITKLQLLMIFVFVTIIISNSIPQSNTQN